MIDSGQSELRTQVLWGWVVFVVKVGAVLLLMFRDWLDSNSINLGRI